MELVYARAHSVGGFGSDAIEVGLWDEAADRLEVIATLSSVEGQHNNAPRNAIDIAQIAIKMGKSFDEVVESARRVYAIWQS